MTKKKSVNSSSSVSSSKTVGATENEGIPSKPSSPPASDNRFFVVLADALNANTHAVEVLREEQGSLIDAVADLQKEFINNVPAVASEAPAEHEVGEAQKSPSDSEDWIEILLDKEATGHSKQLVNPVTGEVKYVD